MAGDDFTVILTEPPTFGATLSEGTPIPGPPGPPGDPGPAGPTGPGVAPGGTTNQVLAKNSGADYDTKWVTPASGGAGGSGFDITATVQTTNYTAIANEFVLFDTTSGARTLTLPTAPANGTQCGARVVTFGAGNYVSFAAGGTDKFVTSSGAGTASNVLQHLGDAVTYQYDSGVWTAVANVSTQAGTSAGVKTNTDSPYTAAVNETTIWSTSGGTATHRLPNAPANGTTAQVYLHTAGNTLTVACQGTDRLKVPTTGPTTTTLTRANQSFAAVYHTGIWYPITDVTNTLNPGTNITLDAASNGLVNINVDPAAAALWTPWRLKAPNDTSAIQSNTTLADDPVLIVPSTVLVANTEWEISFAVIYSSDSTADFKWNFGSTGTGFDWNYHVDSAVGNPTSGTLTPWRSNLTSADQICQGGGTSSTTNVVLALNGIATVASAAATLTFRWAQGTSTATNTIRKGGSYIIARRIA